MINGLLSEPPRTNGTGQRAKIRLKFPISYVPPKKFPKFVWVECKEEGFCIREWRCVTLLAWCKSLGLSQWDASEIYKRRQGLLASMTQLENSIEECLIA